MREKVGISGVVVLVAMVLGVACSTSKGSGAAADAGGGGGGDASTADSFKVTFGPITVAASYENTQCIVVPLGNTAPIHVGKIHNVLSGASHHMIVYKVADTTPQLTPFDCHPFTDTVDPAKGSTLMVTQKKDDLLTLPSGVGYTLGANQMLRIEMHYINATAAPVTLTATSTMIPIADADYHDEAGFLFIGDPDISIPPNASATVGPVFFQLPDTYAGAKFFAITGHEHQMGTNVQIRTAASKADPGAPVYDVPGWSWSEPTTVVPATPFSIPAGGGFNFTCAWKNTSNKTVSFGESANDEMCFFWAYYYPSTGSKVCLHTDGVKGGADFCCPGSANCDAFFGGGGDGGTKRCNTLVNGGPDVPIMNVATDPPAPTGGAIADGTYVVTAVQAYTGAGGAAGPTGATYKAGGKISGGTYENIQSDSGQPKDNATTGTFTLNGSAIDIEQSCPIPQTVAINKFSADSTSFTLFTSGGSPVQSFTYTKQ